MRTSVPEGFRRDSPAGVGRWIEERRGAKCFERVSAACDNVTHPAIDVLLGRLRLDDPRAARAQAAEDLLAGESRRSRSPATPLSRWCSTCVVPTTSKDASAYGIDVMEPCRMSAVGSFATALPIMPR